MDQVYWLSVGSLCHARVVLGSFSWQVHKQIAVGEDWEGCYFGPVLLKHLSSLVFLHLCRLSQESEEAMANSYCKGQKSC